MDRRPILIHNVSLSASALYRVAQFTCQHLEEEQERCAEALEVDLAIEAQPVLYAGENLDSNACR